ncbi:MAG: hypothetical protein LBS15_00100 [Endomicrobium sp.]|jgi:hypothetical protein|nr:hypothetical protein [Endomicrobium sp.]
MSFYNIKRIQFSSSVKVFSVVFTISGIILGIVLFLFNSLTTNHNFNLRFLSSLSFVLIYIVFMMLSSIIIVCAYNFVSEKLNFNIIISFGSKSVGNSIDGFDDDKE